MRRGDGDEEGSPGCCGLCLDKYQFTPSIDLMRVLKMLSALNWAAVRELGLTVVRRTLATPANGAGLVIMGPYASGLFIGS